MVNRHREPVNRSAWHGSQVTDQNATAWVAPKFDSMMTSHTAIVVPVDLGSQLETCGYSQLNYAAETA